MSWTIVFYSPKVEKALLSWPKALQAKLLRILDLIRQEGASWYAVNTRHG